MCYFLCISTPYEVTGIIETLTDEWNLEDVSNTPIGQATRGNRPNGISYLVTEGGCSCSLLGRSHIGNNSTAQYFLHSIERALKQLPAISVLVHVCRNNLMDEKVRIRMKQHISFELLVSLFPNLEEDVRYIITAGSHR